MRFFSTVSQQAAQDSFADGWSDDAEQAADEAEKAVPLSRKRDRSKRSRVPRY